MDKGQETSQETLVTRIETPGGFQAIERLRWLWFGLFILGSWPVVEWINSMEFMILGWPLMALWVIVIVPIITLVYYYLYARAAVAAETEQVLSEGETRTENV